MNAVLLAADHWDHHDGFWFFPLVPLVFLTFWVIVFVSLRRRWHHAGYRSGEAVLAERYARGEIDEREYRERRTVLRDKG
jgi:putative membrane protein